MSLPEQIADEFRSRFKERHLKPYSLISFDNYLNAQKAAKVIVIHNNIKANLDLYTDQDDYRPGALPFPKNDEIWRLVFDRYTQPIRYFSIYTVDLDKLIDGVIECLVKDVHGTDLEKFDFGPTVIVENLEYHLKILKSL